MKGILQATLRFFTVICGAENGASTKTMTPTPTKSKAQNTMVQSPNQYL